MKSDSVCFPCFMEQAHSSVMYAVADDERRWEVLKEVSPFLSQLSRDKSPAYNSSIILHKVNELLEIDDPYAEAKRQSNRNALALVPTLKSRIRAQADRLEAALRLTAAGNVIDLGIKHEADLDRAMDLALGEGFTRFDWEKFKARLEASKRILYVLDNAGEIVFDMILIEGLKAQGKMVVAAVKGGPVLNDATVADAAETGLDKLVRVIDTGSDFVGVARDKSSDVFLHALDGADMVIAKGQGNYETLDQEGDRFFFILKAKCGHVAGALGVHEGDMALASG